MNSSSAIIEFTRAYLAIFYSFVAAFYTFRILAMKRSGARKVVHPGNRYSSTWWNHTLFRAFRITIWMVCLTRFFYPELDGYLGFFSALHTGAVVLTGDILLTTGFALTVVIHLSMGCHWRSGIDPDGPNQLLTDGFYKFSRNPMFVAIAIAQLGFFLAIPSAFSGICLTFGLYTLYRQTQAEEVHLAKLFPEDYPLYTRAVRRWM